MLNFGVPFYVFVGNCFDVAIAEQTQGDSLAPQFIVRIPLRRSVSMQNTTFNTGHEVSVNCATDPLHRQRTAAKAHRHSVALFTARPIVWKG
jgi:hypothetical protein